MKPNVINRRYYDEYFYYLSTYCAEKVNYPVIYENLTKNWISTVSKNKKSYLVVFPDYLTDGLGYCAFSKNDQELLRNLDQKIFVVSSVYNTHLDFDYPNVYWLHAGSDMLFQQLQYQELEPVVQKVFNQKWHYASFSLIARPHRLLAASILLSLYDRTGYITVNPQPHNNKTWQDYFHCSSYVDQTQSQILQQGWEKLLNYTNPEQILYPQCANHNALNINLKLRNIYEHTAIEIVNETTFFNNGIFVSEKFLNSVYGKNFPILLSNPGTVKYLRDSGFDMFDDVIDHSYDCEPEPLQRLFKALYLNEQLLQNKNFAVDKWYNCKSRFESNLEWAKHFMYTNFFDNFFNDLNNTIHKI